MPDSEKCDHIKLEKKYFEEPLDELDYNGIWHVQTSSFYKIVSAIESIGDNKYKCTECGEIV